MSPYQRRGIKAAIAANTLPWLIIGLIIISGVTYSYFKRYVDEQLQAKHDSYNQALTEDVRNAVKATQRELQKLADNDLIINSLIDTQQRMNYLPMFIQSYSLQHSQESLLALTDFQGQQIAYGGDASKKEFANDYNWKSAVIDQGNIFTQLDLKGLFIAVPVIYADHPEGAILGRIGLNDLQTMISTDIMNGIVVLLDSQKRVLYSSKPELLSIGSVAQETLIDNWYQRRSISDQNRFAISAQPESDAYNEVYFIISVLTAATMITLGGILTSIYMAAFQASSMVNLLVSFVAQVKSKGIEKLPEPAKNQPKEINNLQQSFNELFSALSDSNISKQRFLNIINSLSEYLVVFDWNKNIIISNKEFSDFLSTSDLSDSNCYRSIVTTDIQARIDNQEDNIVFDRNYYSTNTRDNSNSLIVRWNASYYHSDKGERLGIMFVGTNVSRLIQAEADLEIKNRAMDKASNGIVITSVVEGKTDVLYVNKGFEQITGYSFNEVIGTNCRFLQGKDTDNTTVKKISDAIKGSKPITVTLLNYRKNGEPFYNELSLTPIRDEFGVLTHYLGIQNDVSDRILAEQKLEQAIIDKDEARLRAEASSRAKAEFVANMSHEIRTPMNGVIGMLSLVQKSELDKRQTQQVNLALSSAESLLSLLNDILDFSKIDAGKLQLETTSFDIVDLLSDLTQSFGSIVQEKGIELILDTSDVAYRQINGDPNRIRQIFSNLIGNAVKFTKVGEVVVFASTQLNGETLILHGNVKDSGIGIPNEKLKLLFEAFTQADASTTREYGGTGLGLTIVQQLCRLMGGEVEVSSKANQGASFAFDLKLSGSTHCKPYENPIIQDNKNVLLVDQNQPFCDTQSRQMQQWGIKTQIANSAPEAMHILLEQINSNQDSCIDTVIIDKTLPGTSGLELCELIRSEPKFAAIKLVLIADFGDIPDKCVHDNLNISALINKPISSNSLLDAFASFSYVSKYSPRITQEALLKEDDITDLNSNLRILLVEDNSVNQQVAVGLLEDFSQEIVCADNGQSALLNLANDEEEKPFDIIFMDCQMPIMDGFEATINIRAGNAGDRYRDIPIVALTANAMKGDAERCLAAGMTDYMAKPIEPERLGAILKRHMNFSPHIMDAKETSSSTLNDSRIEYKIWDRDAAYKRVRGKSDRLNTLIDMFLDGSPDQLDKLEGAIRVKDWDAISKISHTLKGVVSNLGGEAISAKAQQLETESKDLSDEELLKLHTEFEIAYSEFKQALTDYRCQ